MYSNNPILEFNCITTVCLCYTMWWWSSFLSKLCTLYKAQLEVDWLSVSIVFYAHSGLSYILVFNNFPHSQGIPKDNYCCCGFFILWHFIMKFFFQCECECVSLNFSTSNFLSLNEMETYTISLDLLSHSLIHLLTHLSA